MKRDGRRYKPSTATAVGDARGEFRKDHDRLYYTPAFRRLAGVTQVAAPQSEVALLHNRYIHSDKVAQIGRALAEYLARNLDEDQLNHIGGLDADVVAAAGLAHDVGHPPFGHAGERCLHALACKWGLDGFEGNAQTFRVLTKLAVKDETFPGLDLTRATRNAVLKYPWQYSEGPTSELRERHSKKWSAYKTEIPDFEEARAIHRLPDSAEREPSQSVEASIMEIADDISYALHDFEDFYRTQLIAVDTLRRAARGGDTRKKAILLEVQKSLRGRFDFGHAEEAWVNVTDSLDNPLFAALWDSYSASLEQDAALVRLTSFQISKFIDGITIDPGAQHPVVVESVIEHEIAIWKQMTWHFVINRPGFGAVQTGQMRLVTTTTDALKQWVDDETIESRRLPQRLRDYFHIGIWDRDDPDYPDPDIEKVKCRAILDFISSLTEPQLLELHDKLTGAWRSTMIFGAPQ